MTSSIDLQPAPHRAGLDYSPAPGRLPPGIDLSFGIINAAPAARMPVGQAIARRLRPHGPGGDPCYDDAVLLPAGAADMLREPLSLVERYEAQLLPSQEDLLGITTVRFDDRMPHHEAWELARGFARKALCGRQLAVVLVHHVPALAGRPNKQHVHALWPARVLHGCTFGAFVELAQPGAKAILAAEWAAWLAVHA